MELYAAGSFEFRFEYTSFSLGDVWEDSLTETVSDVLGDAENANDILNIRRMARGGLPRGGLPQIPSPNSDTTEMAGRIYTENVGNLIQTTFALLFANRREIHLIIDVNIRRLMRRNIRENKFCFIGAGDPEGERKEIVRFLKKCNMNYTQILHRLNDTIVRFDSWLDSNGGRGNLQLMIYFSDTNLI